MDKVHYFDNAATTYPKPREVAQAMQKALLYGCANAGRGSYDMSVNAYKDTMILRDKLLEMAGSSDGSSVILTPSATIAFNMLLGGMHLSKESVVYVSPFEHNAVMRVLYGLQQKVKYTIKQLPVDKKTLVPDMDRIEYEFCRQKPVLVCITHVSNVTGYMFPFKDVFSIAKKYNSSAVTVCDGCQALGLIEKPLYGDDVTDYYIFAGHKTLYGPFGIGGIICSTPYSVSILKDKEKYTPYICGGTGSDSLNMEMPQESPDMLEAGSINILAVEGLLAALNVYKEHFVQEKEMTDKLAGGLENIPGVRLYLPWDRDRHISIVSFNIEGYRSSETGTILNDEYGIAVRTGYHCVPLVHDYLKDGDYYGTVRASVGRYTTDAEISYFLNAIEEISQD